MSDENSENLDLSESDSSASSDTDEAARPALFENSPLVLELHDLRKDSETPQYETPLAPTTEANAALVAPETKVKRLRKKKKIPGAQQNRTSSGSSGSPTESGGGTVPQSATDQTAREEFYDARESLHTLPENQQVVNPVVQAALAQAQSEHGPKMLPPAAAPQAGAQSATTASRDRRQTSVTGGPITPVTVSYGTHVTAVTVSYSTPLIPLIVNPVIQAALAQAQSEHGPTTPPPATAPQAGAQSATAASRDRRQTSVTDSPVTPVTKPTDTPTQE